MKVKDTDGTVTEMTLDELRAVPRMTLQELRVELRRGVWVSGSKFAEPSIEVSPDGEVSIDF